jgi:hypothetical protein
MKERRLKIGILFPDGDVKWLLYGAPSKDGFVYGVSHADTHITALPETRSVSFHLTNQNMRTKQHLGRIIKEGDYEDVLLKALNPKIIRDEALDEKIIYIARQGMELFNRPSDIIRETETDQERIFLLDLLRFYNNSIEMFIEMTKDFLDLFGPCTVKDILSNNEYEAGFTSRETAVIEVDGIPYEVNIKAYLDLADDENPLRDIIGPLGIQSLLPEVNKRFTEVIEEKKESMEKYTFPDSLL